MKSALFSSLTRNKASSQQKRTNRPIIGISTSLEEQKKLMVTRHYSDWVLQEGGIPIMIPYLTNEEDMVHYLTLIDGLLLTGGGDIDPTLFNEEPHPCLGPITPERDWLEFHLIKEMLHFNKPILAICRGCQILNIAAGGTMYQDLSQQYKEQPLLQHAQHAPTWYSSHTITIVENSTLHEIVGLSQCKTNSFHHQAVKDPAPGFEPVAFTSDGVIEAIESEDHYFVMGVQWHPECMASTDPISIKLFQSFIQAAAL